MTFVPIYLTVQAAKNVREDEDTCDINIPVASHYVYLAFAILTAILEGCFLYFITKRVGNYIPDPFATDKNYDENELHSSIEEIINVIKQKFKNKKHFTFFAVQFFKSQVARYDLYTDVIFIITCFSCHFDRLGYAAAVIFCFLMLFNLYNLFSLLFLNNRYYSN